jgi:hypothetical protein
LIDPETGIWPRESSRREDEGGQVAHAYMFGAWNKGFLLTGFDRIIILRE